MCVFETEQRRLFIYIYIFWRIAPGLRQNLSGLVRVVARKHAVLVFFQDSNQGQLRRLDGGASRSKERRVTEALKGVIRPHFVWHPACCHPFVLIKLADWEETG